MKASHKWIQELVPELPATPEIIDTRLTAAGLEVEGVERQAQSLPGVITASVRTRDKHPSADKLSVCTVFDGTKEHTVICGAPNVRAGLEIAFAPVGTTLPGGLTLDRRQIRGVDSEGMICSEAELGLSDEHDGIMELEAGTKPGQPLVEALGLDDTVFELGVTPNRPDVLSHLGIARELAAIHGLALPKVTPEVVESDREASARAQIEVPASDRCTKYVGRVITGVKVGPSPREVQDRLRAIGQRPISNVVDATNLALMEIGHPLHAFDLDRLAGAKIIVRMAEPAEKIDLLDGTTKTLDADDLVIADAEKAVALAGVMGGANSEVHEGTVNVLLEAAVFDPSSVRRTARRHGLHTEASHRFERGVDPAAVEAGIDRCAQLIAKMAGGEVHRGRLVVESPAAARPAVPIRAARASMLIGRPVDEAEVRRTLEALGLQPCEADPAGAERYRGAQWFRAPSWRIDLGREEDLIEEVGRLHGYDDLPAQMPPGGRQVWTAAPAVDPENVVRDALVGAGYFEAISLAFAAPRDVEAVGSADTVPVVVANPLGEESQLMRRSLVPALLKAARLNQDNLPSVTDVRLFEIGRTFEWRGSDDRLPEQRRRFGVLLRGDRHVRSWGQAATPVDAFDLKGTLEQVLEAFGVEADFEATEAGWLHPRSAASMRIDTTPLGWMGEVHPNLMERYGLEGPPVCVAELDLDALEAARGGPSTFQPLPKLPPAQRDLSFFVARQVPAAEVLAAIRGADPAGMLEAVDIFDVYEGKGVADDEKSLAVSLIFRAAARTLTDQEVEGAQSAVIEALQKLGARLRTA